MSQKLWRVVTCVHKPKLTHTQPYSYGPVLDSCQHPLIWCVRDLTFWQATRRTAKLWELHARILQGNHNARAQQRSVIKASVTSSLLDPTANGRLVVRWVQGSWFDLSGHGWFGQCLTVITGSKEAFNMVLKFCRKVAEGKFCLKSFI